MIVPTSPIQRTIPNVKNVICNPDTNAPDISGVKLSKLEDEPLSVILNTMILVVIDMLTTLAEFRTN
jgi:carbon monoxide dehydrogenase subunit G